MRRENPNSKHQAPEKSQIPSSKSQENLKHQVPNTRRSAVGRLELAVWNFVGIWNLEFGVCGLKFLWTLMLGAWCFLTAFCPPPVAAATLAISPQPLHPGHINPMLFGNFIELLDIGVVGRFTRPDDRHRRVVEDGVAGEEQEHVRAAAQQRERVGRAGDL